MRIHNVNILDERHLFKHIKVSVALTRSAVDNGKGQRVSVLKNQQCRYNVELVDFAGDIRKGGAGIGIPFKFDSEKQVGLIDTFVNARILIEGERLLCVLSDFVSGELEEEISGLPFVEGRFLWVYEVVRIKVFSKRLGGVGIAVECALAFVA